MSRIRTLISKEFIDLARNRGALVPVILVVLVSLLLPFGIVVGAPAMSGRPLSSDSDLVRMAQFGEAAEGVSIEARIQVFLFQQFLVVFLLTPITGAMALASHAVVGEKQARTLEPLLATPITTSELLVAKVLGALLPTLAISLAGIALYFAGIYAFAAPGVLRSMAGARTAWMVLLVAPAAALVSLQAAIVISSRVNDARTAQQFGVLIIVPLAALVVAQFMRTMLLSTTAIALIGAGLLGVWALLTLFSVALFERESILTRWR